MFATHRSAYISVASSDLYNFTTHTFTNASATGRNGPTLLQCQSAYNSANWTQNTNYFNVVTQGLQLWTVPKTGSYRIEAAGAAGGKNTQVSPNREGGYGAVVTADVNLTKNDVVVIVVGQKGGDRGAGPTGNYCGGGGGGGTFVYRQSDLTYYVVAGGGGGAAASGTNLLTTQTTAHGKHNTTSGTTVTIAGGFSAAGGTDGNGGSKSTRNILFGGPGAGINSSGASSNTLQGRTRTEGWLGGSDAAPNSDYEVAGGFGGGGSGGAGENNSSYRGYCWAGGGGGYSGGGCGGNGGQSDGQFGGGGGSYNAGILVSGTTGTNNNHGYVIITKL